MRAGEVAWDWWTLVHAGAGAILGLAAVRPIVALVVLVGWELVELVLRQVHPGGQGFFEFESLANISLDIAAGVILYAVGYGANWRRKL